MVPLDEFFPLQSVVFFELGLISRYVEFNRANVRRGIGRANPVTLHISGGFTFDVEFFLQMKTFLNVNKGVLFN